MSEGCRWDADRGWLTVEHVRDCKEVDCAGCKPCGKSHCALHGRCPNHVEQHAGIYTCPSCIGKTKRQVRAIGERYAELPDEYEFADVHSEVLNLHGPSADPAQWAERRKRLSADYEARGWCEFPRHGAMADDDPYHPLSVLSRWDQAVRDSYSQSSDLFVTVSRAVDYLAGDIVGQFAQDEPQLFEDFAKEVRSCLSHLEDVLALTQRPEQGAPCPTCRTEVTKDEKAPRLVKRYGRTEAEDTWHCPRVPEHWWTHVDYRLRVDGDYLQHATALTAAQMHNAHGIKPGTLRQWAARGQVAKRGLNAQGQMTYDVKHAVREMLASRGETCNADSGQLRPGA